MSLLPKDEIAKFTSTHAESLNGADSPALDHLDWELIEAVHETEFDRPEFRERIKTEITEIGMVSQRLGQEAHQSPRVASQHRYANRYALVTEVATRRDVPLNKASDQSKVSKTFPLFTWFSRFHQWFENGLEKFREGYRDLLRRFCLNRGTTAMKRYKIRRMAERLALKIIRKLPQDRFEQELWHLAAIIEKHLFSELVQLDEAERRTEETEANFTLLPRSPPQVENCRTERIHPESRWVPLVCDLIYRGKNRLK